MIDIAPMADRMEAMIRAGDDAERSDEEERRINPAGDNLAGSDEVGAPPACGGRAAPMINDDGGSIR